MNITCFTISCLLFIIALCCFRTWQRNYRELKRLIAVNNDLHRQGFPALDAEELRRRVNQVWLFEKIFGCTFAAGCWFGNCFSPAVVFCWNGPKKPFCSRINNPEGKLSYPAWATLTIRTRYSLETIVYWRGAFCFDVNSNHIARWFGTCQEMDFGNVYSYNGFFGRHMDA